LPMLARIGRYDTKALDFLGFLRFLE
jgi:hypothetical protein